MAEKRHLEAVGAVTYNKLPRLDVEPGHVLAAGLCRSSALPGYASENHYSYNGSYFTYPLQCHEGPKSLTHWTPTEAYPHCTGSAVSQQLRTEKALCMLYRHEAESVGARGQTPVHEKGNGCMARDALTAQEKWANYMGHAGVVQQGWMHGYPAQHSPRMPVGFPTLAVPKPVYRNHGYSVESDYSPKGSLALGMQVESVPKRSPGAEWALSPSGHPVHVGSPSCGPAVSKKSVVSDSGFLPLHQGPKDASMSSASFSAFGRVFEKCQEMSNTSFLETSYPAVYNSQKNIPEAHGGSPGKHAWSKLPPSASSLTNPQNLMYQDRSTACYPLTSYPLTSHDQMLLYHQSYAQAEKPNSLFPSPACKGFGSRGGEDPQLLAGSYLTQTPRSYYPSHLESYLYRSAGPPPVTSPGLQPLREHEPQQSARSKVDLVQETPISACALSEKDSYCGSFSSRDGLLDWREGEHVAGLTNESFQSKRATPQHQVFQGHHSVDKLPGFDGLGPVQEATCRVGLGQLEKARAKGEEPSYSPKNSALTSEGKKRNARVCTAESEACVVISDSPVTSHDSCPKEDPPKNIPGGSCSSFQNMLQSPEHKMVVVNRPEEPLLPPSSPPMPVINNVFSLAPYQEYLEGSAESAEIPLSKSCQTEEPSLDSLGRSMEGGGSPQPDSVGSSKASRVQPSEGKEMAYTVIAEVSNSDPSGKSAGTEGGSGDCAGTWESCQVKLLLPSEPVSSRQFLIGCANGGVEGLATEGHALDLSFKMEGVVDVPSLQRQPGKTEAVARGSSKSAKGKEMKEKLNKRQETNLQLPMKSDSVGKSNFHSSATFLYKKFKIPKSHATGAGSAVQPSSSSFQLSSHIFALASDFSLQQDLEQAATEQTGLQIQQSLHPAAMRQNSLPVQQSFYPAAMRQNSPPAQQSLHQGVTQPETPLLPQNGFNKLSDASKARLSHEPAGSPALVESQVLLPTSSKSNGQQNTPRQHFTTLHTSVCAIISCSVSASSPEQLKEWLEKAESKEGLQEKVAGSGKARNGSKASEAPTPSKGKEIWLAFKDMAVSLNKLLSQLETILFTCKCPFPHVIRAGTIFIPIHVVKKTLFPNLSSVSVDHVLQDHKVELRPTTLSEERLLRDLELKSCTSRMLKLLALKQLPNIYPDLLNLHWHDCVKQQLGPSSQAGLHTSK
ncbi:uncharacterized protein C15orf39 homolog isoform X2 [Rhineura floridana]|uniref:uncharacterized protein C15orf39 homolog isoform X2 n=1 Tax=Rhineura floridana TaxID=261503 RepID=UPI002AC87D37|nr:uncharacterized protein C15orf39 homolog isoform X2 [Rhineura floridana]